MSTPVRYEFSKALLESVCNLNDFLSQKAATDAKSTTLLADELQDVNAYWTNKLYQDQKSNNSSLFTQDSNSASGCRNYAEGVLQSAQGVTSTDTNNLASWINSLGTAVNGIQTYLANILSKNSS